MPTRLAAALLAVLGFFAPTLQAQSTYPSKPVHVLVGYTTGGSADAGLRPLAKVLEPLLGQSIIIDYKPGAAGAVAMEYLAKAPADGYTLYYADNGPLTIAPHMYKVAYDSLKSFTHLGHVCGGGSMLVVHPSTPFMTAADVMAAAKREPNKWSYGTSGIGGPGHLAGEYFKSFTGVTLAHVPYKGGAPAMTDLMGGQIPMLFSSLAPVVGAAKQGRVRPLAVTTLTRSAAFPDVPTMDEAGLKGFEATAWFGLVGPAGLPPEVVSRIAAALQKASEDKPMREQHNANGCDANILTPAQTTEKVRADYAKWGKVIKDAGIKPD